MPRFPIHDLTDTEFEQLVTLICREVMGNLGGSIGYLPGQRGAAFRVVLPLTR